MVNRDSEIIAKILSMSEKELTLFMNELKPDTVEYLDNLLHKASVGVNTTKLKNYLNLNV